MKFFDFGKGNAEAKQEEKARSDQMTNTILSQNEAQMDESTLIQKREVLVQLTKWQQDRSPQMQKLFHKLSGTYYDSVSKTLKNSEWDIGYCSLLGAAKLVNFIEPLDHNVMLANWGEKNLILTLRDSIAHPLRRFIFMNNKELGITIEHAEYVFWNIVNTVEPNYWRGWNNGERAMNKEIIKINEVRQVNEEKKKRGLFGID